MRILHFYKTSNPSSFGGVEQFIHQLSSGLVQKGHQVEVLSLTTKSQSEEVDISGYRVHMVPLTFEIRSNGFSLGAFFAFRKLVASADIVHYHFPWPFMDLVHFVVGVNKPTVVSYHSDIIRQKFLLKIYRPLKNRFLKSVDSIVAASPNYLVSSDVLNKYLEKVDVIPYGLNKDAYPKPSPELLKSWSAKLGGKFFLFLGVLRYYKGLHILLDAAVGTDYPIMIAGAGPIEQELKQHAAVLGLKNVFFLGQVSEEDKVALISLSYCVLFPSHLRSEAFGIALLEGAMYGKPMISSEIGTGTTFINIHHETGLVVRPGDSLALRSAMKYLWDHPEESAQMGRNAERRYKQLFTSEQMVESYLNLYCRILNLD